MITNIKKPPPPPLPLMFVHAHRHIVNVTPDLANVFEGRGDFTYLRVPIIDHSWSQNHVEWYFKQAVDYIGEWVRGGGGVDGLVVCLWGF